MTVISTIFTRHFTALASDSFITQRHADGSRTRTETKQSKLVRVREFRGAMAYWGLATLPAVPRSGLSSWSTKAWLDVQARSAGNSTTPERFAESLAELLNEEFARGAFHRRINDTGLGIHFTAYEDIDGIRVPELFIITNWRGDTATPYSELLPGGFDVTRETWKTILRTRDPNCSPTRDEQRKIENRLAVQSAFRDEAMMLVFNNGDPMIFNPIGNAIFTTFLTLNGRRDLKAPRSVETHLSLVRRPVEVVAKLLADLSREKSRVVGGKLHDLAISPTGIYESTTGD
jgi:hypothetical protein